MSQFLTPAAEELARIGEALADDWTTYELRDECGDTVLAFTHEGRDWVLRIEAVDDEPPDDPRCCSGSE